MIELIKELNKASKDYYNFGTSNLTDKEFDEKLEQLKKLEKEMGLVYSNSPTQKIGAPVLGSIKKVKIQGRPMLSLNKVHSTKEITNWAKGQQIVGSIKCDGLSCRLTYEKGILISANTRGDGEIGGDITEHVKYFTNVPLYINKQDKYVIDGEAIIKLDDFEIINKNNEFKNPRNTAAGTLNLLDMSIVKQRRLSFIAWDVIEGGDYKTYSDNIVEASQLGFEPVFWTFETDNDYILLWAKKLNIPCDGVVWKYEDLTFDTTRTDKFFNNAVAWKPANETYDTKLLDIEYTIGRTGKLTPVAVFEPVDILGSECERASLHNLSIMEQIFGTLCPDKGTPIKVFKADLIIPQVKTAEKSGDGLPIPILENCPICGEKLIIKQDNDSKVLFCPNEQCEGKFLNIVDHYAGKSGLDIKGLSKATLTKLMSWGWLNSLTDLYKLNTHKQEWYTKSGFGIKSVDNILSAIEASKKTTLNKFIAALGIPLVGSKVAKDLASHFGTWDKFMKAVDSKYEFYQLPNFGIEMHKAILNYNYAEARSIVAEYLEFETVQAETADKLSGLTFVITGKVYKVKNRDELKAIIENNGGKVTGSVSKNTNYLINNDVNSTSAKNVAATRLGIPILTEEEFFNLI